MQLRVKVHIVLCSFPRTLWLNGICIAFAADLSTNEKLKYTFFLKVVVVNRIE